VYGSTTITWHASWAEPPPTKSSSTTCRYTSPTQRERGSSQIHNWDDLVRTFVGNFQGTYVHPGNSWDLCTCTQKPDKSLQDFIRRFSKRCTELPSVA
jgi:hypothetical protein